VLLKLVVKSAVEAKIHIMIAVPPLPLKNPYEIIPIRNVRGKKKNFPGLDGQPIPTTPSTKKVGVLDN